MALKFEITGDNSNAVNSLQGFRDKVHSTARDVEESGVGIEDMFKRIAAATGIAFGVEGVKSFISKVFEVRSYFQDIESSMQVFLGSQEKAAEFTNKLKDYAYYNMFEFSDLANASKQMIAYGHDIDDVIPRLDQLSNIATGTSTDLMEMVNLYNRAKNIGTVGSQALDSWAAKGLVVKDVLKSMGEEVDGTAVTFEQLNRVLDKVTGEGGMFHDLMLNQMNNLSAEIGQFEDELASMFNEIGEKYQDVLKGGVDVGIALVENYQTIAKVIMTLVTAYGAYKAAVMVCYAWEKAQIALGAAKAFFELAKSIRSAKDAMLLLNMATKANPIGIIASIAATAAVSFGLFRDSVEENEEELTGLAKATADANEKFSEEAGKIDALKEVLDDNSSSLTQKKDAIEKLTAIIPNYNAELDQEGHVIRSNTDAIKEYLAQLEKQIKLKAAQEELEELYRKKRQSEKKKDENQEYLNNNEEKARKNREAAQKAADNAAPAWADSKDIAVAQMGASGVVINQELQDNVLKAKEGVKEADKEIENINSDIEELQKEINTTSQEIENAGKKSKNSGNTLQTQIAKARENVAELKKELANLRSGKTPSENYAKDIEEKAKELNKAKGKLNVLLYGTSKKSKDSSGKVAKEAQDLTELKNDIAQQRIRSNQDLENRILNAQLEARGKNNEILRQQRDQANKEEIQSIQREKENAIKTYVDAEKKLFDQQEAVKSAKNSNYKKKTFDKSSVDTSKIASQYDSIISFTSARQQKDILKEESDALNEYLINYGTYEQRKLATTEQYEEKIKAATTEGEKLTLQEQMKSALSEIDTEALRHDIDWANIFGDMGNMLYDEMRGNLDKLDEYMNSDEFMSLDATDQKNIVDVASQMRSNIGGGEVEWSKFGEQANNLQSKMEKLSLAKKDERLSIELVKQKQEEYNNAISNGNKDLKIYENALNDAKESQMKCSEKVKELSSSTEQAARTLNNNLTNAVTGLNSLSSGLQALKSGSLQGAFEGLKTTCLSLSTLISGKVGSALGSFASKLGGVVGQIVGAGLGVLDVLKDGISSIISSLIDTVLNAVNGLLSDVLTLDGVEKIVGSITQGVTSILDTLSFGALDNWFGGNVEDNEKEIEKLSESNELLAQAIDGLSESISDSDNTNSQSVEAAKKALKSEEEWEANQRKSIDLRASEYSNSGHGFLGLSGEHSFNYYAGQLGSQVWSEFTNALKSNGFDKTISGVSDVWSLSPDEMKCLRDFAPSAWASFINSSGESNPKELIEAYIERAGVGDSLLDTLNKKLTGYTWSGFKDSYTNALSDLSSTTEDFSENIEDMISKAIIQSLVTSKYQDRIKALYKMIADYAEDDDITKEEADAIRAENEAIANAMIAERQRLLDLGIIKDTDAYSQEASSKGFEAMDQDTGEELNGRFTALQIAGESINAHAMAIYEYLTSMGLIQVSSNTFLQDIRNMLIQSNSFLDDIAKYSKKIYLDFTAKLDDLVTNTKNM